MPGKTRRELPVRKCEACGGEFFRETTVHQWLQPTAKALVRNPSGQLGRMSLTILVCLCGAPQPWKLGGLRGGRTPNGEISRFLDSFGVASAEAERRNDPASVLTAAEERLVKRKDLQAVSAALAEQERAVGRLLSGKHPTRRADNACWRPPKRKNAARFGRDWLAIELQKRG